MSSYADARRHIDEVLGRGEGMAAEEAWAQLSGRIHLHSQQYTTLAFDGPRLYAKLAEAIRPIDDEAADFCRWL